jgi:hypothetical protein
MCLFEWLECTERTLFTDFPTQAIETEVEFSFCLWRVIATLHVGLMARVDMLRAVALRASARRPHDPERLGRVAGRLGTLRRPDAAQDSAPAIACTRDCGSV